MTSDYVNFLDGLFAYEIPHPNLTSKKYSKIFEDQSYDGEKRKNRLINGTGKLTDSLIGKYNDTVWFAWIEKLSYNFRFLQGNSLLAKYENKFVGWKQEEVQIVFRFDKFRKFKSVSVYSNRYEENP